jgi:uncharacterized metal-binding protein YceD (DUF177 family)
MKNSPFSRPFNLRSLPSAGREITISANQEECENLAKECNLDALLRLTARFILTGKAQRGHLKGIIEADIRPICVITLEPFDTTLREEVDLLLYEEGDEPGSDDKDYEVLNKGHIDLGRIAAEFLALGLDPYPRKPGL